MNNKQHVLAMFLALFLVTSQVGATPFSSLYVFGDSLADIGSSPSAVFSIYKLLGGQCDPGHPCPPYSEGRISNGPVSVEYLADSILPGGGASTHFFSFATAGSTTGIGNFGDGGSVNEAGTFGLPGMAQQIGFYLPNYGRAEADALYFVWGGANDLLTGDSPNTAAKNVSSIVGALALNGVQHILVPNLPDLSLTPFVQSQDESIRLNAQNFSVDFNQQLASQLGDLSSLFPATDIVQFNTFNLFNDIVQNPAAYGFTNAAEACLTLAGVCANQNEYVFWDDFHPTTQLHAFFGSAFVSQVPLPASIFFLMASLVSLCFSRQRLMKKTDGSFTLLAK